MLLCLHSTPCMTFVVWSFTTAALFDVRNFTIAGFYTTSCWIYCRSVHIQVDYTIKMPTVAVDKINRGRRGFIDLILEIKIFIDRWWAQCSDFDIGTSIDHTCLCLFKWVHQWFYKHFTTFRSSGNRLHHSISNFTSFRKYSEIFWECLMVEQAWLKKGWLKLSLV